MKRTGCRANPLCGLRTVWDVLPLRLPPHDPGAHLVVPCPEPGNEPLRGLVPWFLLPRARPVPGRGIIRGRAAAARIRPRRRALLIPAVRPHVVCVCVCVCVCVLLVVRALGHEVLYSADGCPLPLTSSARLPHTTSPMHSLTVVSLSRLATFRYYPRDQYQWLDFVERENVRHCIEVRDGACLYSTILCVCVLCVCVCEQ